MSRVGGLRRALVAAVAVLVVGSGLALVPVPPQAADATHGYAMDFISENADDPPQGIRASAPAMSADGEWVVFHSSSRNLPTSGGNPDGKVQVWLMHRVHPVEIYLVSANMSSGSPVPGNGHSQRAVISGDGSWVAFLSEATDLSPADGSSNKDVYLANMADPANPVVTLLSTPAGGAHDPNAISEEVSISASGNRVAFTSTATLTADDEDPAENPRRDVYVAEVPSGALTLVSRNAPSGQDIHGTHIGRQAISGDGRFVVFYGDDNVPYQSNYCDTGWTRHDVYVVDVDNPDQAEYLSPGTDPEWKCWTFPAISSGGTIFYVTQEPGGGWRANARGLAKTHVDAFPDFEDTVEVLLTCQGDDNGLDLAGGAGEPGIRGLNVDALGTRVAFETRSPDVCTRDYVSEGNVTDIFTVDFSQLSRISVKYDSSSEPNDHSTDPWLTATGTEIVFDSDATDLIEGNPDGGPDPWPDPDIFTTFHKFPYRDDWSGIEPWEPLGGDPVGVVSGDFFHERSDVAAPAGSQLGFGRTYNSRDQRELEFGSGWSHSFSQSVEAAKPVSPDLSDVTFVDSSGRRFVFVNESAGVWARARDLAADLSHDPGADPGDPADDFFELVFDSGDVWTFDPSGRLAGAADAVGGSLSLDWAPSGTRVLRVDEPATGRWLELHDASPGDGRVDWLATSWGSRVDYGYDSDGELASVSEPGNGGSGGGVAEFYATDHPLGLVTEVFDGRIDADRDGVADPGSTAGRQISNLYGPWGQVLEQTTASGQLVTFDYHLEVVEGSVWETVITFDPGGPDQEVIRYRYNSSGEVTEIVDPTPQAPSVDRAWTAGGQLGQFTNRRDASWRNIFEDVDGDGLGDRLRMRVMPDPDTGQLPPITGDPGTQTGDFEYFWYWDDAGSPGLPDPDPGVGDVRVWRRRDVLGEVTEYSYEGSEQIPEWVKDPAGGITCVDSVDGLVTKTVEGASDTNCDQNTTGEVVTVYAYGSDDVGVPACPERLLCSMTVAPGTAEESKTVYEYDPAGRVSKVIAAYGELAGGGSPGETTTEYRYDDSGRVVEMLDPIAYADFAPDGDFDGGHYAVTYSYDAGGRLEWMSDESNPYDGAGAGTKPSVEYTYTADGQIETETRWVDISGGGLDHDSLPLRRQGASGGGDHSRRHPRCGDDLLFVWAAGALGVGDGGGCAVAGSGEPVLL